MNELDGLGLIKKPELKIIEREKIPVGEIPKKEKTRAEKLITDEAKIRVPRFNRKKGIPITVEERKLGPRRKI